MSADIGHNGAAVEELGSFVSRIEALETEIAERNSDKSEVYKEAKDVGYDVTALREVIKLRRKRGKDPAAFAEHESIVELYLTRLDEFAGLVRAREAS